MPKTSRGILAAAAALSAGMIATQSTGQAAEPVLRAEDYHCRPVTAENRLKPPPPLPLPEGMDAKAAQRAADDQKLPYRPCPKGQIAYPDPVFGRGERPPVSGSVRAVPGAAAGSGGPAARGAAANNQNCDEPHEIYHYVAQEWNRTAAGGEIGMSVADPELDPWALEYPSLYHAHSLAQISMSRGDDTVELGWKVDPRWADGQLPTLFTVANPDDYGPGYCNNCHFVGIEGARYKPGQVMQTSAVAETLRFGLMSFQGNWWVWVGDQWIGYIRGSAWNGEFNQSARMGVQGEVSDCYAMTQMGTGSFGTSEEGAIMRYPISYTTTSHAESLSLPPGGPHVTAASYYNAGHIAGNGKSWKYGGPGYVG